MKTVTEAVRSVPLRSLLTGFLPAAAAFLLSGAALDGLYSPWALAAVSAAGVSWPGLSALLGAGLGAFLFLDFQAGLRHTAAALMLQNGVDVRAVQEVLGHEHLNTTEIYTHIDNEALRVAAKANPLSQVKTNGKIKDDDN